MSNHLDVNKNFHLNLDNVNQFGGFVIQLLTFVNPLEDENYTKLT